MKISWMLFALMSMSRCQDDDDDGGDLDSLMNYIYNTTIQTEVPPRLGVETCVTPNKIKGECVNFNLCGNAGNNGEYVVNIRLLDGPCKSYLDVCCVPTNVQDHTKPLSKPFIPREGCGWRNPNGVGMVTIGDVNGEAKFGEFPWMVAVLKKEPTIPGSFKHIGGGSLIHQSVVVTGAHVVLAPTSAGRLMVRAGEWDTQTTKEPYPHQDRDVGNVIVHKDYKSRNLANDIALLFLNLPMMMTPNVGLVCLPALGQTTPPGTRCLASGWGKDQFGEIGKYQVILKKLELPVVGSQSCQKRLRMTRLSPYFNLDPSFMCAGGEGGRDTCVGDGGSPLVCPLQTDRYVQAGIVAWGIGCGGTTPGVYTDVAKQRAWVDEQMTAAGYDTSSYTMKM
ncbi:phenoloxidase-activating factor 2-like [Papilio machaon]|uniref:phenoloxidase-activating factor 2-like n=1 Tax=Papilio machaon TaxID=76193 RepID=UPI001E663596|nr:phenoloxidase-activating factor 2-like [Papilio machaon]